MKVLQIQVLILILLSLSFGSNLQKAEMLAKHGLVNEAKSEIISFIFSNSGSDNKAKAYFLLGNIAYSQNDIAVAVDTWKEMVEKYPTSEYTSKIKSQLAELSERMEEVSRATIKNSTALLYLKNGDFWSLGKDSKYSIDNSWIPAVESAIKWYDKVISEFPSTPAAKIAYEEKINTLFGWSERGQYGSSYGIKESFKTYMPLLLEAFKSYEEAFPQSNSLQSIRYQIVQAYWGNKKWTETKEWLNVIIQKAGDNDSFYKDLAKRRLEKVEY